MRKRTRTVALLMALVIALSITYTGLQSNSDSYAKLEEVAAKGAEGEANTMENPASTQSKNGTFNGIDVTSTVGKQTNSMSPQTAVKHYPTIIIPGMGQSDTYFLDENGNRIKGQEGSSLINFDPEPLNKLTDSLLTVLLTQKKQNFIDELSDAVAQGVSHSRINKDGVMISDIEVVRSNKSLKNMPQNEKKSIYSKVPLQEYTNIAGEQNLYFFAFEPLGDPFMTAAALDDYIQMVLKQTGSDKVNLVALSLGGTILTAYLDEYAEKGQVNKIINVVAALNGSKMITTLFSGNLDFSNKMLYSDLFPQIFEGSKGYLANILIRLFPKKVLEGAVQTLIDQLLDNILLNSPSIWALVPHEDYNALAKKHLSGPENAVLRAKTDRYHAAQGALEQTLKELSSKGVEVYNIAAYGLDFASTQSNYSFFGIIEFDKSISSDGLIQASSPSMGATFAPVGETFPANYVQKNTKCSDSSHNHISSDNSADVSTAAFPEQTWLFTNQHHDLDRNDVALSLISELLLSNELMTVESDPRFPQFNGARDTKNLKRSMLPRAKNALRDLGSSLSAEDKNELIAAIAQGEEVFTTTIATPKPAIDARNRLENILMKINIIEVEEKDEFTLLTEIVVKLISDVLYKYYGGKGLLDWIKL